MIITVKVDDIPLCDFSKMGVEVTRANLGVIELNFPEGVPCPLSKDKRIVTIIFDYGKRLIGFSDGEMWEVLKSGDLSKICFSTGESLPILDLTQVEEL